jgi:hypothetical protein
MSKRLPPRIKINSNRGTMSKTIIPKRTIQARFEEFHAANPHVYTTLMRMIHEWLGRGNSKKCSLSMFWEVLRWQRLV